MAKKIDATTGNLIKKIFAYTIPLILSTMLQNSFTIADQAVLGNIAGSVAVASIGATSVVTSLIINGAVGLSTGVSIILARYVGQKDEEKMRKTIDTALITAVLLGVVIAVAGVLLAPMFLKATNCPNECFDGAVLYARIFFIGAPATLFYNYSSAVLRTLGDTKRPLYYITVAGVVNVVLNVILCLILPQKVAAVAIATIASRVISSAMALRRLNCFDGSVMFSIRKIRFCFDTFVLILRFGVPTSVTQMMLPLANLQITPAINSYGADAVAGNAAAISLQNITVAVRSGFAIAATTFIGQNIGAQNKDRVRRSFWYTLGFGALISEALGAALYFSGRFWIGIIVGASSQTAIDYGMYRMFFIVLFTFVYAISNVLAHSLQAFGYPFFTSISNIAFTLGFRVVWMQFVYPLRPQFSTIMLCFLVSWTLNGILYAIFFAVVYRRYMKKSICKKI